MLQNISNMLVKWCSISHPLHSSNNFAPLTFFVHVFDTSHHCVNVYINAFMNQKCNIQQLLT